MKQLRVLVLVHDEVVPPADAGRLLDPATWEYRMELAVVRTLRRLGHEVQVLGVADDLAPIHAAIATWRPHLAFNILSYFHDVVAYEANLVAFFELCKLPYTGCNSRGIVLAGDKVLAKQVLAAHGIPTPRFLVAAPGEPVSVPPDLAFPLLVKTAAEHGSAGIAQASVVQNRRALATRVRWLQATFGGDVLVEPFLPGREFSVGVLGNERPQVLPVWETWFERLPPGQHAILTARSKWDERYQRRVGLRSGPARRVTPTLRRELEGLARRTFRALRLSGYARIDFRLDAEGRPHVLEANVNPDLTPGEDFPLAAQRAGMSYARLLQRLVANGLAYRAAWRRD